MEVMGLMLGEFIDDYTVRCIGTSKHHKTAVSTSLTQRRRCVDVFAMPQSGTGVSVEAVDPVFQAKMLEMLRQTGRYDSILLTFF